MLPLTRSRNRSRFFGIPFSPAKLFAGGTVAGAWYDPSDLSTMFDTSAGTTPVAMPGLGAAVSVGLMLDKSQGLVLGSELFPDGACTSTAGWTANANTTLSIVSESLRIESVAAGAYYAARSVATVAGNWYKINFDVTSNASPTNKSFYVGTSAANTSILNRNLGANPAITTYSNLVRATSATTWFTWIAVATAGGESFSIDNVSVRELPGNHAIAFNNTTARPELRARVNLLTYSEEFDNAAWSKLNFLAFGSGSIANATTAPNGTVTADLLVPDTLAAAEHYVDIGPSTVVVSGTTYTISFSAKAGGYKWLRLAFNSAIAPANERAAWFDIEAGVVGTVQPNVTASIQAQGDGWYRCSISRSATASTTTTFGFALIANADQGLGFTANGTSGMYWWGADLRPANIGANVPAYQRIADANTYDTSGFPLYLRFDGIDDSMYTPANLNLSATDKVAVFAGVRKLSDAAQAVVTDTVDTSNFTIPSFTVWAPNGNGLNNYGPALVADNPAVPNIDYSVGRATTFTAPITNVVTSIFDWAGSTNADKIKANVNGISQTLDFTNSVGTMVATAFGSSILRIGSRMNTSSWLDGQLYSLIIAGSAVSAGNISATEQWVAGKTGIVI